VYAHHHDKGWTLREMSPHDAEWEKKQFGNDMPVFCNVITGYKHPQESNRKCLQRVPQHTKHNTQCHAHFNKTIQ
jgi:hypothetical protein